MCQIKATTTEKAPPALKHFVLKNGAWNYPFGFYENFNWTTENIKQKIIDISSKSKLDFAHISAYLADGTNVNLANFIQSMNSLPNKMKWKNLTC